MKNKIFIIIYGLIIFFYTTFSHAEIDLTFIHTNDIHAHLLPTNEDGQDCNQGKNCLGGFARLKTFIDMERLKEQDLILLDAGDRFSGTFFYTFNKEKELVSLFNILNFDAITLGNHEFDDEVNILEKFLEQTKMPCVVSNVSFPQNIFLQKRITPSLILKKKGIDIAFIGALTDEVKTTAMHAETVKIKPTFSQIEEQIKKLKNQGISIIVLLSHLGLEEDKKLAGIFPDIDIIIGGHTHSLLSNADKNADGPYPISIKHSNGRQTLIVSTGAYGRFVGKLNATFNDFGEIISFDGDTIPLTCQIQEDEQIKKIIQSASQKIDKQLNKKLQTISKNIPMTNDKDYCTENCLIGQFLTSIILTQLPKADIVLINSGAIRSGLQKGDILLKHLIQVLPFDTTLVLTTMTGKELKQYIEQGLIGYKTNHRVNAFLQIAGATYQFNHQTHQITHFTKDGKEIDLQKTYTVVLPLFLAKGGDQFTPLSTYHSLPKNMLDLIQDYLKENKSIAETERDF